MDPDHHTWFPILVDVRLSRLWIWLPGAPHPMFLPLCLAMISMVSEQGCGFLDHFKKILSLQPLSFSFYSIYWQTDLIRWILLPEFLSSFPFCSTERERATSFTLVQGLVGLERACPSCWELWRMTPTALKSKAVGTFAVTTKGWGCQELVRDGWWGVHTDTLTHTYTPQWQMTHWNNFRAALWLLITTFSWLSSGRQGLWRQLEAEPVAESTWACLWEAGWVLAAAAALHAAASRPRGYEHDCNSATSARVISLLCIQQ